MLFVAGKINRKSLKPTMDVASGQRQLNVFYRSTDDGGGEVTSFCSNAWVVKPPVVPVRLPTGGAFAPNVRLVKLPNVGVCVRPGAAFAPGVEIKLAFAHRNRHSLSRELCDLDCKI